VAAGIATALPWWAALLIVMAALLVVIAVMLVLAKSFFQKATPPLPEQAIEQAQLTRKAIGG
jgi:hypothetical protein